MVIKINCFSMLKALLLAILLAVAVPRGLSFAPNHRLFGEVVRSPLTYLYSAKRNDDPAVVSDRVFAKDTRPVILFDGVCNMCNSAVNLALDWDPDARLRFAALQSSVGRALLQANGRNADDISSIVLVTSDGAYIKSDAVLRITEELTPQWLPLPLVRPVARTGRLLIPAFFRDLIYDGVADNRYKILGIRDECRFGDEEEFASRFVDDSLAV
jgi:predicted DCC family thiol-disulfide oxidoreductase YuxK